MPEGALQILSARLWDLRAQCEQQIRSLTDAQRLVDEYRIRPHHQTLVKQRLAADVQQVVRSNHLIREAAEHCVSLVDQLPAGGDPAARAIEIQD